MKKILVTGGYGLVGSEFIKPNFIPLSSSDADLRVRKDVDNVFNTIKFDCFNQFFTFIINNRY